MTVSAPTHELAGRFINSTHLTEAALYQFGAWYRSKPSTPCTFRNFLREDVAAGMAEAMRSLPMWKRRAKIFAGDNSEAPIGLEEWEGHPRRWLRNWIAQPATAALEQGAMARDLQHNLEQFLAFSVMGGPLRSWMTTATGLSIDRLASFELAAYGLGDLLEEHNDQVPNRVFAVNFYLDPEYEIGDGARLGYRNELGEVSYVDPLFNSASVIPIVDGCVHWIEPFLRDRRGRYTVSVGLNVTMDE